MAVVEVAAKVFKDTDKHNNPSANRTSWYSDWKQRGGEHRLRLPVATFLLFRAIAPTRRRTT